MFIKQHFHNISRPKPTQIPTRINTLWNIHTREYYIKMRISKSQLYTVIQMNCINNVEQKKTDTKDNILCNSFYIKFKKRQNHSTVLKIRTVITLGGICGRLLRCW